MAENFAEWVARSVKGVGEDFSRLGEELEVASKRIKPTFQEAYSQAQAGKPKQLLFKGTAVGLGAYITAHGINDMVRGAVEEVEHPTHDGRTVQNTTRIFWGAAETMTGLTSLYFGLTKSNIRV